MTSTPAAAPPVLLERPDLPGDLRSCSLDELLADEARLRSLLPPSVLAFSEAELRLRARHLRDARRALDRRQAAIGEHPHFHVAAEQAVLGARDLAHLADAGVAASRAAAHRLLLLGNVIGVAMIAGCVLAVAGGVSPLSTPLGVLLMAAAGGPIGAVIGGLRGVQAAHRRRTEHRLAWTDALARAGFETMGELAAARIRHDEWRNRCEAAQVAADHEQRAAEAWHEAVGAGIDPSAVGPLAAVLRQLRAVHLELLRRRIGALAVARSGLEVRRISDGGEAERAPRADQPSADRDGAVTVDGGRLLDLVSGGRAAATGDRVARRRGRRPRRSAAHPSIAGVAMRDAGAARSLPVVEAASAHADAAPADAAPADDAESGSLVLDLLERVRGKGLHLWTGD